MNPLFKAIAHRRPLVQGTRFSASRIKIYNPDFISPLRLHRDFPTISIKAPPELLVSRAFCTKNTKAPTLERTAQIHENPQVGSGHPNAEPTSKSYQALMRAHIQAGEIENTLDIMDKVLEATKKKGSFVRFGSPIFEEALAACANAKHKKGGFLAEEILEKMHTFDRAGILARKPDIGRYNSVINAWAKSNHHQAAENAERILQRLKQSQLQPDTITYTSVMDAWAKQGDPERADQLLMEMCDQFVNHRNKHAKPNIRSFTIVLDAHAKSDVHDAGIKAEHCLQMMWKLYDAQGMDAKPDVVSYTCVIDAWANSGDPEAGSRAENVFTEMFQRSEKDSDLVPTTVSLNSLVNALVKSSSLDRAVSIVGNMCLEYEQGNGRLKPDAQTFNIIIDGIARRGGINAGREAEAFLGQMEKMGVSLGVFSYSSTIHAWSQSGDPQAGQAATRLLQEMTVKNRDNPDTKPNITVFNAAIDAWAKSRQSNAGVEAEKLLREMISMEKEDPGVKPDVRSYSSAIAAWAKSGHSNAGVEGEKLLREMISMGSDNPDINPNVKTYSSAIDAWAKSGHSNAGVEAEKLLQEMISMGRDNPDIKPNVTSFNAVINAWASQGNLERAEALLKEMISRKDRGTQPDVITFTSVISALSKSPHLNKGGRADQYLQYMENLHKSGRPKMKPNLVTYKMVFKCWTKSNTNSKANRRLKELDAMIKDFNNGRGRRQQR